MSINQRVLLKVAIRLTLKNKSHMGLYSLDNVFVDEIADRLKWKMLHTEKDIYEAILQTASDIIKEKPIFIEERVL